MNHTTFTRRQFAHLLGAGAAAALVRPNLAIAKQSSEIASKVVRLSSNENPYGPSPKAIKAMTGAFDVAGRYPDEHADKLVDAIARLHSVPSEQVL
jgi:histidinol-phosphate/aromatic aminotransferase/cobyric acid decarboxylase-like protein